MRRKVVGKAGARRTVAGRPSAATVTLDDRPLELRVSVDGKRLVLALPYEVWVINAATLEVENTIELPVARPTPFEAEEEGVLWIGGAHLHRGSLFSATATKVGTKLGGFVDYVCLVRPRLLCGVGSAGEILWDLEKEEAVHRRKAAEHHVVGLVATADGRGLFADGSPHAWVIDPEHASGYMKLKLKASSPVDVDAEGIVAVGATRAGRCILAASDGAVGWTNRALRLVGERFPRGDGATRPVAVAGDDRWIYVLRAGGLLHRFLIEQPQAEPSTKEEPEPLPEAQLVRLPRQATAIGVLSDGRLALAGPQSDNQLGRLWLEDPAQLAWESLRLGSRTLVEQTRAERDEGPKRPDFTPTRSKIGGPALSTIKVDDVLAAQPRFWITRDHGALLERPTAPGDPDAVLGNDALLLPAMFRLHQGTARPGLVLWPGVADQTRPRPDILWLAWGDEPRAWTPLETPWLRQQGWARREVFPLQVALPHPPPQVPGRRPKIPQRWVDRELFEALAKECKKLLEVLW